MTPAEKKYLADMLERARFLVRLAGERSLAEMPADRVLRSAVERELMVLGEALYLLHEASPQVAERIDRWREIIAMRHKLVHGYSRIDPRILQQVVENDLAPLVGQLEQMLDPE